MPGERDKLGQARRWVIKVGSALLTGAGHGLDRERIGSLVEQMAGLRERGCELVLVSSGAVAAGMAKLGWQERPHALHELQAVAAIGQMSLVRAYETAFQAHGLQTAQILLSHDDVSARERYLNARGTLSALLGLGVVSVVNENDTVVTEEIRFGDNDTLGALVANLLDADGLLILTDQDGLYDADPRHEPGARLLPEAAADDPALAPMAGGGGGLGRGGMITKLRAAKLAARSGTDTVIANGSLPGVVGAATSGAAVGTWLRASERPLNARKQWLAGIQRGSGTLVLDDGAVAVLQSSGRSLLPVGVKSVAGQFRRGDMVVCTDSSGREVARGLVNYSVEEARAIIGLSTRRIEAVLGYQGEPELVHRDNLVLN